jgi:hypothetical protein
MRTARDVLHELDRLLAAREIDPTLAALTGQILGGLVAGMVGMPELDEAAAIDQAIRMARATLAQLEGAIPIPPTPAARTVLTPDDLTYLGSATLPLDVDGQTRFGYSTGALSGRVVDGAIHLFITGAQAETGWMDPVYEVAWTGAGTRCTLVTSWGDVTCGTRASAAGNPLPLKGLLWDPVTAQLLWTFMDQYNVGGSHDPCLGASHLLPDGPVASGPWRLACHSMRVGGYLVALPEALQSVLHGSRFAAGAPIGSGNATSPWGAYLSAFALPPEGTPPDTPAAPSHITIPTTNLIYSDFDHKQSRTDDVDECGWTHYGESDSQGAQPQNNPTQDGTGCTVNGELCGVSYGPFTTFTSLDVISAGAFVSGPTKQGLVLIGQMAKTLADYAAEYGDLGRCHVWYGPAQEYGSRKMCAHGQNDTRYGYSATGPGCTTMANALFIYDGDDLAKVAQGTCSPILLPPTTDAANLHQVAHDGPPFPQLVGAGVCTFGGAWWEPESATLFVSEIHAEWQGEWRPILHAFRVTC